MMETCKSPIVDPVFTPPPPQDDHDPEIKINGARNTNIVNTKNSANPDVGEATLISGLFQGN